MKRIILFILATILVFPIFAQKVKYKKGTIYVNKKKKFLFKKTKKGGLYKPARFYLANLDGEHIIDVIDTNLTLYQLPYEESKRIKFTTYSVKAPKLNKNTVIPFEYSYNVRKSFIKKLKKIGFFKTLNFDEEMYSKYIDFYDMNKIHKQLVALDSTNAKRKRNYKMSVEAYGEFPKRKPGNIGIVDNVIYENKVEVCKFELDKKSGGYATIYNIKNINNKIIGIYVYIPREKRANIKTNIDNKRKWFNYKNWTAEPTQFKRFNYAVKYLFEMGYL